MKSKIVIGCRMSRRDGEGGRGMLYSRAWTHHGSTPLEEDQTTREEQVVVEDVVGMLRSFQRMLEALI
jgi:hypothetical protein